MKKVKFLQLTKNLQNSLVRLRTDLFLLRGQDVTEDGMEGILKHKESFTKKRWRSRRYGYMKKIDEERKKFGLTPIHFNKV